MPHGHFTAKPVTMTINNETLTWAGRGRKPKWLTTYESANGSIRPAKAPKAPKAPKATKVAEVTVTATAADASTDA